MKTPENAFRKKIGTTAITYGIWNNLPNTLVAEILAGAGFDWLLIDAEHGPFDLRSIMAQLQAIAPYDVAPIVRPTTGDPILIKQLLDAGVQTFLVPMVESAEQAANLVRCMRYPPAGNRGVGAALGRATSWNRVEGYLQEAERELCLIVQVESISAFQKLDAILEVDGVDGVFFGPADLSASIGLLGQTDHPEVVGMVKQGLERTRKLGKIAGTISLGRAGVTFYEACGANMIGVGADALLLTKTVSELAGQFR